jgi:hypothetical protein
VPRRALTARGAGRGAARSQIFDVLLQVLGDGRLTGGQGRTVDFCDTILIRTSPGEAGVPNVRPWA